MPSYIGLGLKIVSRLCKTPKVADFNEDVILITLILIYNFQDSELYDTLRHYAIVNGLEIVA